MKDFTNNAENPPAIRIIDTKQKKEILFKYFEELGSSIEPEMIDFDGDSCYYTDHYGNVYKIIF